MRRFVPPPDPRTTRGARTRWHAVAGALRTAVASGGLAAGEWLPSVRKLGATFGVHRHTVEVAIDALVAEGLLETEPRRGVRVVVSREPARGRLPSSKAPHRFQLVRGAEASAEDVLSDLPPNVICLHAATPDVSLLPAAELRAAYARALRRPSALSLGIPALRGHPELRAEIARYLRRARGLVADDVLLTHGSQEAIALAAETLVAPGDRVLVENPGYLPAFEVFRDRGAVLVPLALDAQGVRVDELARALEARSPRLVYLTPNHQYPTTATLATPRRAEILSLTRRAGVPILEDDYDHEYHYRGEPQAPLAAWQGAAHVLYVGTLSKLVAPGVRIGFAAGAEAVLGAMARRRRLVTRGNDGVTQAAMADWMSDGGFERHVRRARRVYLGRRDAALAALERAARRVPLEIHAPDGGLAVWTVWPEHDVATLARQALAAGVVTLPESALRVEGTGHGIRLAFGAVSSDDFSRGLDRLVAAALHDRRPAQRQNR